MINNFLSIAIIGVLSLLTACNSTGLNEDSPGNSEDGLFFERSLTSILGQLEHGNQGIEVDIHKIQQQEDGVNIDYTIQTK